MSDPKPSFHPAPSRPRLKLPRGACDVHFHVFGPQAKFPFAAGRSYTPADAPKEKLFALHKHLGIERGVVVQSAAHGYDNSAAADLIAARRDDYLGVALVPTTASVEELKKLQSSMEDAARSMRDSVESVNKEVAATESELNKLAQSANPDADSHTAIPAPAPEAHSPQGELPLEPGSKPQERKHA